MSDVANDIPVAPEALARMRKVLLMAERNGWNAAINACRERLPPEWSVKIKDLYNQ